MLLFSGFHLPDKRNVQTGFLRRFFGAQILGAQIFAPIFAQIFGAQIFAPIFAQIWRLKKIGVPESRKNAQKIRGKICGRPNGPARGGTPFHLRFLEQTARHTIAARPTYSRRACERPS